MRFFLQTFGTVFLVVLLQAPSSYSQPSGPVLPLGDWTVTPAAPSLGEAPAAGGTDFQPVLFKPDGLESRPTTQNPPLPDLAAAQAVLEQQNRELQQVLAQADKPGAPADEALQKKIELLQKQIEVQQKMIQLIVEQLKRLPGVEDLQVKVVTLEARTKQAAQRDQDLAQAIDNINDHMDAEERNGPRLPAALKEMFLGSRTNETPLSINGTFFIDYSQFNSKSGQFGSPDFAPYFLMQLNEQFLLVASIDHTFTSLSVGEAQANWLVSDWATVVAGRYITPIGFFNERLNHEWIHRLPDIPLMFRQVSPLSSTDGLMLRGGFYIWDSPVKIEYDLYGGNGLQAASAPTTYSATVDLEGITGGSDVQNLNALGGRIGLWIPAWGVQAGISSYFNGRYSSAAPDQFNLWQIDLNYRKGNWDVRFEYCDTYQQATNYVVGNNIRRKGYYAQVAYRPYDCEHCILRNLEIAARYSRVWFHGIDPNLLDPTAFATPIDVPVDRDQWTVGVNYYFYPSMALRLAYEVNHEFAGGDLHDSIFLAQYVWAF
jgi:hypothetical protein